MDRDVITQYKMVELFCSSNQTFKSNILPWIGFLKSVNCNKSPQVTAEPNGKACFGGNNIISVGYKIDGILHKFYDICFDSTTLSPIYSVSEIGPASQAFQTGRYRPPFFALSLFGDVPVANLYKQKSMREAFADILGPEMAKKYFTKQQFPNRGHLSARSDFLFKSGQYASMLLANVAPQWSGINSGNWNALEVSVSKYASATGKTLTVYTGVYNVSTLPDAAGCERSLYLHRDQNNNLAVPVPMYYYKVVYDAPGRRGTAFVTVNNPHHSPERYQRLVFCDDLCRGQYAPRWLRWRLDDAGRGFSFCCDVRDFNSTVRHLPHMQLDGVLL